MHSIRLFSRPVLRQFRSISISSAVNQTSEAQPSVEKLTIPPPSNVEEPVSPKIDQLAVEISKLTLIEVSELSTVLKKRLNLPDAPVMPMGGFVAAGAPQEDEEVEVKRVKSSYNVKLMKYDEKQKVPLIKEVKSLIEGMNLVQAKKFVESAPAIVKADISKEEAEKLKEALTKVGATIEVD